MRSDHSGGAANLSARTVATGWCGDVDRGGEVVASDRPDRNDRAFRGARHRQVGRHMASMCLASSDRQARVEVRRSIGGPLVIDFPTQN
jgi:hypothetical protein